MGTLSIEKVKIQEMLNNSPDNIEIEDFIDQLIITAKIEKALDQLANGDFLTSEQLDEEINKWQ
jgi:aspartyl aminopeptidase